MAAATDEANSLEGLRSSGALLLTVGLISTVAGVLAIAYPDITLGVLVVIAGINIFLLGVVAIVDAVGGDGDEGFHILSGILGLVAMIAGLVVLREPGKSLLAVVVVVGIWFVIRGAVEALLALIVPGDRGWRLLGALVDVVIGVLVLSLPELSVTTLAVLIGISFVIRGLIMVWSGWVLRRAGHAAA